MIRRTYFKPDVVCSADGCDVPIGKGKLFCKGHYFSLPKAVRDKLWCVWRKAMEARRLMRPRLEQNALNAEYQAVFQECCDHLRGARPTTADAMSTSAIAASGQSVTYIEGRML